MGWSGNSTHTESIRIIIFNYRFSLTHTFAIYTHPCVHRAYKGPENKGKADEFLLCETEHLSVCYGLDLEFEQLLNY
jgi:hypothetical protein